MKLKVIILMLAVAAIVMPSMSNAYVDAKYWIKDDGGNLIYMINDNGTVVYGNILVGQDVIFDASQSKSFYKGVDKYYWDFDGDGRYDKIISTPYVHHTYGKAGTYYAKLLAVDTSGPNGASDTYIREVRVVEKYAVPVAIFGVSMAENTSSGNTYIFDASHSYDPDGYIKYYNWDFDGDGNYDLQIYRLDNASWSFNRSGYYAVTLKTEDWDGMVGETTRVLKVNGILGEGVEAVRKNVTLVNEGSGAVNVTVTVNNCDVFRSTVADSKDIQVELNPDGPNDICVNLSGTSEKYFLFNPGDDMEIRLLPGGVIEAAGGSGGGMPGFGLAALLVSLAFVLYGKKSLKI